ncbi:MAG: hypothetical protein H6624_12705 [Bdellovibrionaceae bacterium]|nr:hypothetical protein [Bdellovibrionales bacterium]MCB9085205.1 hypothetical protein [Pseudobdellovibrionaceae bacterium]
MNLREDQPQQYSFLMIHEWLWDRVCRQEIGGIWQTDSCDVHIVRDVNRYFHSQDFFEASSGEVKKHLHRLGFLF